MTVEDILYEFAHHTYPDGIRSKKAKSQLHQLMLSALPKIIKDKTGETPEGTSYSKPDGSWITAEDYGYNQAISDIKQQINQLFEEQK